MIEKLLVANRGEIALRVLRTCREMGIATVAVYSSADRGSPILQSAGEVVQIGPGPASSSYLRIPAIVEAARMCGADAVHPGYGFLSENADFTHVCAEEGLTFVGPPAEVMTALSDKSSARSIMAAAGLPLLPGVREPLADRAAAVEVAEEIGYPVILKAVAGGGGRGMTIADGPDSLAAAYDPTAANALAVFRDGRLYLERYLGGARHVEVQILADHHGHVVHLGARDCSVQRRHQKLVEETPPPNLSGDLLDRICQAAVKGARAAGYVGAGTFEFLLDDRSGEFFFMEVNCRLQVEHPVTEAVLGLDLVSEQLRIAAGQPLTLAQGDVTPRGHAIECRVNAEDPARDFTPTAGRLDECTLPGGPFIRVDTHVAPGSTIPPFYDPLLAKVISWGRHRTEAIERMARALDETRIEGPGIATTTTFLRAVMADPTFRAGEHDTSFLGRHDLTGLSSTRGAA